MGMGGVVITSFLTVQPEIDGLQVIAARDPWATALGRLAIHHMLNPAVAGRQQMLVHQRLNTRLIRTKFPLLAELPRQLAGGIRIGGRVRENAIRQIDQCRQ